MKLRFDVATVNAHALGRPSEHVARESHDMIGATGTAATAPRCTASSWDLEHAQGPAAA